MAPITSSDGPKLSSIVSTSERGCSSGSASIVTPLPIRNGSNSRASTKDGSVVWNSV
jgi:hypothetical protein